MFGGVLAPRRLPEIGAYSAIEGKAAPVSTSSNGVTQRGPRNLVPLVENEAGVTKQSSGSNVGLPSPRPSSSVLKGVPLRSFVFFLARVDQH